MIKNYPHHLLILFSFIHFSNCNWLRLGIAGIEIPEHEYIEQFNSINKQRNLPKKMHPINDSINEYDAHRKLFNKSITKYFNYSNRDIFFNHYNNNTNYDSILSELNASQLRFIKQNANILKVISSGTNIAILQCALRFEKEKWNCSIEDEKEVFGQTLKRANRESGFVHAIISAGITYSLTKACSTGNLTNCACNYQYERFSDFRSNFKFSLNRRRFNWAGCSDNLKFGIKLAKQFLDLTTQTNNEQIKGQFKIPLLRELVNLHNNKAGREAIKKLMRLKCRCHGLSGSCQLKTCWKVLPNFNEIGKYLKTKYQQAVLIEGMVNQGTILKLRRSKRSTSYQLTRRLNDDISRSNNQNSGFINQLNSHNDHIFTKNFSQTSEIELQTNSFIMNKIHSLGEDEGEIDEDEDYNDEEYFNDKIKGPRSNDQAMKIRQTSEANELNLLRQVNDKLNSNKLGKSMKSNDKSDDSNYKSPNSKDKLIDSKNTLIDFAQDKKKNKNNRLIDKDHLSISEIRIPEYKRDSSKEQPNKQTMIGKQNGEINLQFTNIIVNNFKSSYSSENDDQLINKVVKNQAKITDHKNFPNRFLSLNKNDIVYIHKSPNYCLVNDNLKILGTSNRTCRKIHKRKYSDSCDLLCCGRGYDKRMIRKLKNCHCEFDVGTVQVKCELCQQTNELYTCK